VTPFYDAVCAHYDDIFPTDGAQVRLVEGALAGAARVLEIGAATGNLAIPLAAHIREIVGIELSAAMVAIAEAKAAAAGSTARFLALDMRELGGAFAAAAFDGIVSVGNTIVHLRDEAEIAAVIGDASRLLAPGGRLLLQVINYQRILDGRIAELAPIDNAAIRFERRYAFARGDGRIDFDTVLTVKASGERLANSVPLFPIEPEALRRILAGAGFTVAAEHGSFRGDAFAPASAVQFVVVARKG
jgi:SAM-dependent methyltransferase